MKLDKNLLQTQRQNMASNNQFTTFTNRKIINLEASGVNDLVHLLVSHVHSHTHTHIHT